jgi:hypothetical protein
MRVVVLAAVLFIAACSSHSDRLADTPAIFGTGSAISQCRLARPIPEGRDSLAVKCAEAFVLRNGYTDAPVTDSTLLAHEFIEPGGSALEVLQHRRSTLAARAILLCNDRRDHPGFTVAFAYRGDTAYSQARAVTMDTSFGGLRIEHVDFLPRVAATSPGCTWLAASAR